MAKQIDPLESERATSSIRDVTQEFNPTTQNSSKESLEKSELEMRALKLEIRELRQSREDSTVEIEKLRRKSVKKKNELNTEKLTAKKFGQLIEELNRRINQLETAPPSNQQKIKMCESSVLNEEMNEKIILEKSGLESQVSEQNREIDSLTSQLNSSKEQLENISKENSAKLEEMNEKMQQELEKYRKDKHTQNQEQEQINILQTSLSVQNRKLEEKNQKQETELNTLKDLIQDMSKQKQELRKRNEQHILQYKDEVVSRDKQISELRKQIEGNKQDKQELENKIKALNDELEQQKCDYEDLNHELKRLEEELENLKKELEGKKNDFEEITVESTKDIHKMRDKFSKIEKENKDLQQQVDILHTLVNGLKVSTGNLKFKLDYSDKEKEKTKTENDKLKKELAEMADQEKMKKDIETSKIEELEKELKSERESSAILKQLIGKLNEYVKNHTGDETVKLKEELEQAEKYKNSLEYKLEQMSKEIANRDSEIQQLSRKNREVLAEDRVRNIEIPRSDSKSKSEKNLFPIKIDEKEKSKVAASKISADKPLGAEGGSPISTIKPILNPTTKSPLKFKYRGTNVNALKLKALPSQKPHINKQVLCLIKKNLELGTLMAVLEVPTKVGFSTKVAKYVGVLLNEAVGDSDGTFQGNRVFQCERNHGWFAPLEDVFVPVI